MHPAPTLNLSLLPTPFKPPKPLKTPRLRAHSTPSSPQGLPTTQSNSIQFHFKAKRHKNCLQSYHQLISEGAAPSRAALALAAKSCAALGDLRTLRIVHNDAVRFNMELDGPLAAAFLKGFAKCGCMGTAHQVFERMPHRDVVSWTIVISGYCKHGLFDEAVGHFRAMVAEGVAPDDVALVSVLSAAIGSACLEYGVEVHGYLIRRGFELTGALITSLVNMYVRLGRMDYAARAVSGDGERDAAAWTALMTGHVSSNDMRSVLLLYEKMMSLGIAPHEKTISCVLRATAHLGLLRVGSQIHGYILKGQVKTDKHILSGLIEMYGMCGAPASFCRRLFDQMLVKDVVSFTTMIQAYSRCGEGRASLWLFHEMVESGVRLDSVACTAVLSACTSCGMLQEGLRIYNTMVTDWRKKPTEQHFACLRNLIAKNGRIEEAYEAIKQMPIKDDRGIWEAFLAACRVHGNAVFGEIAARELFEISDVMAETD